VATYPAATPVPVTGHWNVVASPAVGQEGTLVAVAALSAADAWAVGQYEGTDAVQHPLAEHWDGAGWGVVSTPSPGTAYNFLQAVSADAPNDVWAVGQQTSPNTTAQPLIEHWNGAAWSYSAPATQSGTAIDLSGVAALSTSNVWAVGSGTVSTPQSTTTVPLIEHWDGSRWSIVTGASLPSSSSGPQYTSLSAVAALSANDVWAVGSLIEHWNGSAWSVVATASGDADFTSVSASAANDVWAAGTGLPSGVGGCGYGAAAFVDHWDGSHWTSVSAAVPPSGSSISGLTAVSAASASDVWVVGGTGVSSGRAFAYAPFVEHWDGAHWNTLSTPTARTAGGLAGVAARPGVAFAVGQNIDRNGPSTTHIERWTGGQWAIASSPSPGTLANALHAVTGTSARDVWAVGSSAGGTLAEHWDGSTWSVVPSANAAPVDDVLYGASAASSSDVWAVGAGMTPGSGPTGLIEHWNGAQWSSVIGAQSTELRTVAAISPHDVWAGGDVLEHYDGSAWHTVSSSGGREVLALAPVASNDVWAVGGELPQGCGGNTPALIQHWNGSSWSVVPNTPLGTLYGVAALGPSDVWAVGTGGDSSTNGQLVLHFDGRGWSALPARSLPAQATQWTAVAGRASNDLWAVGVRYGMQSSYVVAHWDGAIWGAVSTPANPGPVTNELDGVAAFPGGDAWAVGSYGAQAASQALLLHYTG
jgi:hypothetical protein